MHEIDQQNRSPEGTVTVVISVHVASCRKQTKTPAVSQLHLIMVKTLAFWSSCLRPRLRIITDRKRRRMMELSPPLPVGLVHQGMGAEWFHMLTLVPFQSIYQKSFFPQRDARCCVLRRKEFVRQGSHCVSKVRTLLPRKRSPGVKFTFRKLSVGQLGKHFWPGSRNKNLDTGYDLFRMDLMYSSMSPASSERSSSQFNRSLSTWGLSDKVGKQVCNGKRVGAYTVIRVAGEDSRTCRVLGRMEMELVKVDLLEVDIFRCKIKSGEGDGFPVVCWILLALCGSCQVFPLMTTVGAGRTEEVDAPELISSRSFEANTDIAGLAPKVPDNDFTDDSKHITCIYASQGVLVIVGGTAGRGPADGGAPGGTGPGLPDGQDRRSRNDFAARGHTFTVFSPEKELIFPELVQLFGSKRWSRCCVLRRKEFVRQGSHCVSKVRTLLPRKRSSGVKFTFRYSRTEANDDDDGQVGKQVCNGNRVGAYTVIRVAGEDSRTCRVLSRMGMDPPGPLFPLSGGASLMTMMAAGFPAISDEPGRVTQSHEPSHDVMHRDPGRGRPRVAELRAR
uniref:Uncharacterized protein n=1 Tax=Branchiostoma floridae TaxID=7739 RepID=C3YZB1_BRAFL|eukprot:XP_002598170.1 hypothetical protein BRAFLDRAFT_123316 [Branchiostoma floridae]